jgi:hypothetical protein
MNGGRLLRRALALAALLAAAPAAAEPPPEAPNASGPAKPAIAGAFPYTTVTM